MDPEKSVAVFPRKLLSNISCISTANTTHSVSSAACAPSWRGSAKRLRLDPADCCTSGCSDQLSCETEPDIDSLADSHTLPSPSAPRRLQAHVRALEAAGLAKAQRTVVSGNDDPCAFWAATFFECLSSQPRYRLERRTSSLMGSCAQTLGSNTEADTHTSPSVADFTIPELITPPHSHPGGSTSEIPTTFEEVGDEVTAGTRMLQDAGDHWEERSDGFSEGDSSVDMVSVSSWDMPDEDLHRQTFSTTDLPQAVRGLIRQALLRAIRVNHFVRYISGSASGRGMHTYVLSDAKISNSDENSPGQTHPAVIMKIINCCAINSSDLVVDLGSGEGVFGLTVAAITGCEVYGVEKFEARYALSQRTREIVCARLSRSGTFRSSKAPPCELCAVPTVQSNVFAWGEESRTGSRGSLRSAVETLQCRATTLENSKADVGLESACLKSALQSSVSRKRPAAEFLHYAQMVGAVPAMQQTSWGPAGSDAPLCRRVLFECDDMLDALRRIDSPLLRARVVFANNFNSRWGAFQDRVLRLVSRVMPKGSILVSFTRFTKGRRGDGVLSDIAAKGGTETVKKCNLFYEVSAGWQGPDWSHQTTEDGYLFPRALLFDDSYDDCVNSVWMRGRLLPQSAALARLLRMQQESTCKGRARS
jgi:hypothetical protein